MKRHLLSQMRNEWRSNLWMIIELTIISIILWFLFSCLLGLAYVRMRHYGYDMTDIYSADVRAIKKDSPLYQEYDSVHSRFTDLQLLLAGLRANPYVELVGTGSNALPYNYNYSGARLNLIEPDSTYSYYGNQRTVSPEVIKIIRLEGLNGESTDELAAQIEQGNYIISDIDPEYIGNRTDPQYFRGKEMIFGADTSQVVKVGALAYGMRRSDYEPLYSGVIYGPIPENFLPPQMVIRVKPGMGHKSIESLTPADKQVGNVYISALKSTDSMRDVAHLDINILIRNFVICAVFLLIVIFLSFLGTFWFRTQQRVGEIAVRKVNGATRGNILSRFFGEGLALLCVASIIAVALDFALISLIEEYVFQALGVGTSILHIGIAVTFAVMALLIIAGIWLPARKAMNVNPALALKDQ